MQLAVQRFDVEFKSASNLRYIWIKFCLECLMLS